MAKKVAARKKRKATDRHYVVISAKSYGLAFRGQKIYFEGDRPSSLKDDGTIALGKHILELIRRQFRGQRVRWIISERVDSVTTENPCKLRAGGQ